MRRRHFITLLGAGAASWPLAARAQQHAMPVIGFLNSTEPDFRVSGFEQGLKEVGYVDGQNVTIDYRWARGHYDRLPALAAELVRRPVNLLAATTTPAALAAKAATTTIPIVFTTGGDPVKLGLVTSLNRPGGNLTGASMLSRTLAAKQLGLLRELLSKDTILGFLVNPNDANAASTTADAETAADAVGYKLVALKASTENEIDAAFATLAQQRAGALIVDGDSFFITRRQQILTLAERESVPAIYAYRQYVIAGGLMSYAPSLTQVYRQAGIYAGRILKGEKPGELPVTQPTKFEFVINLKTAKTLGLDIPPGVLAIADEVIE